MVSVASRGPAELSHRDTVEQTQGVLRAVAEACSQDREAVAKYVKTPWLHVLDSLLALKRAHPNPERASSGINTNYGSAVELWRYFGEVLRYKEDNVWRDAAGKRGKAMGGLKGCSQSRCPLFESVHVVPGREFLRCSRCKKVCPLALTAPQVDPLRNLVGPIL